MNVLFLNHKIQQCGVYQYGYRVYNILKKSSSNNYYYEEIENIDEYERIIKIIEPNVVIFNYHVATMPWLRNINLQTKIRNIIIPHESTINNSDIILTPESDGESNNIYNLPRPIYENIEEILNSYNIENTKLKDFINYKEENTPIFGSFGFGFRNKGFDKIINIINDNYDKAIIKLIITSAFFDENRDRIPHEISQLCYEINKKPNIKVMIYNEFVSNEEILIFLSSNTANIFLYDYMMGRGASSAIDYAISVKKPFVISDSFMFRHIYSDDICVYKTNIKDAINNSIKLLPTFIEGNSNQKLINKIEDIINKRFKTLDNTINNEPKLLIYAELSVGEIIDKYSILELKLKYIKDNEKLKNIKIEIETLSKYISLFKQSEIYKFLFHINELIWLDTDIIKNISLENNSFDNISKFAYVANRIFENNQRRFRIKNHFNIVSNSFVKEEKSYNNDICFIEIEDEKDIYNKIPEINYICISHDIICIKKKYEGVIHKLFENSNIFFTENDIDIHIETIKRYSIKTYNLNDSLREYFEFTPITYKSGGRFGDFFNQLSVVCENFYKTGKKGILYINQLPSRDDHFTLGIEGAYNDTYNMIKSQIYIKDYLIFNDEVVDIDLSAWRNILRNLHDTERNWCNLYKLCYNIEWGKHKWIETNLYNESWSDKIIIYVPHYRFLSDNSINKLYELIKNEIDNCVFVYNKEDEYVHYEYFCNKTNIKPNFYMINGFEEMISIINSCKLAFFGFTSHAVIANALHKKHYMIGEIGYNYYLNNIKHGMPNVIDILI